MIHISVLVIFLLSFQILKTGFFHADPHPGNLAIDVDETLIYYDFGMMGEIKSFTRSRLLELFYAVYEQDAKKVCFPSKINWIMFFSYRRTCKFMKYALNMHCLICISLQLHYVFLGFKDTQECLNLDDGAPYYVCCTWRMARILI